MADSPVIISLGANLPKSRLVQLTRDLERDLSQSGVESRSIEAHPSPGEKGETVTLGVIALAFITSGALKTLIECIKIYISREPSLVIKLKRSDGTQIEVNARNISSPELESNLRSVTSRN